MKQTTNKSKSTTTTTTKPRPKPHSALAKQLADNVTSLLGALFEGERQAKLLAKNERRSRDAADHIGFKYEQISSLVIVAADLIEELQIEIEVDDEIAARPKLKVVA